MAENSYVILSSKWGPKSSLNIRSKLMGKLLRCNFIRELVAVCVKDPNGENKKVKGKLIPLSWPHGCVLCDMVLFLEISLVSTT